MTAPRLFSPERSGEGVKTKKPTARFASGGGFETFCWLAVSPLARSARSGLNRRSPRSGPLGGGEHSLGDESQHAESITQGAGIPTQKGHE